LFAETIDRDHRRLVYCVSIGLPQADYHDAVVWDRTGEAGSAVGHRR
jgi:hypothetical protein